MAKNSLLIHPGFYIRKNVLDPRGLTVTDAAKLIGLSRQSVSNFLNEKASATPNMAARLERAFGVSATEILEMQTKYDAQADNAADAAQNARSYVPSFLHFKANDIENYFSGGIPQRAQLPVLLRVLIHSTGRNLQKVDFPGNDDAERLGWDGFVEAGSGTPWVPSGISGWEFGVNANVKSKADGDFAKRVQLIDSAERANITFVFVTPRRWLRKNVWVAEMKEKRLWKDVRAYDASDLEQWMEQSLAGQNWFADRKGCSPDGVRTLDHCWRVWAGVTTPELDPSLFSAAVETWKDKIESFLVREDSTPLVIKADSVEEALAFLRQAMELPGLERYRDQVLVFEKPEILKKLAQGTTDFIAVAENREVEREMEVCGTRPKSIVVYPPNVRGVESDIELEPLENEAFSTALNRMDKSREEIEELARTSGRSLTVLRRRLSGDKLIHKPVWAENSKKASWLVPLVFIGTWDTHSETDQKILSRLADTSWSKLDKHIGKLLLLNDSPLWSISGKQGVISKIDSLFAIADIVTQSDLERFFNVARMVLSEDDPALDLPEKDRWAAILYGKKRKFSDTLREEIADTLVLLAVHGTTLFGKHFGFNGESKAGEIVNDLLVPITTKKLEANGSELPFYAEAAPALFLDIIERGLRENFSEIKGLLRPASTALFSSCPRAGLLWALEKLAWNPDTFLKVVRILGRLSEVEINDNWGNKPIESLYSILCAWMPQTAADYKTRLKAVAMLLEKFPEVGWRVCMQQFGVRGSRVGRYNSKPKWRSDGRGCGEPVEEGESVHAFVSEMVNLALTRPHYSVGMLCDLVSRLHALASEDQVRVWKIIDKWHDAYALDGEIATLRETIRVSVLSRTKTNMLREEGKAILTEIGEAVYAKLQPKDVVIKYEWLFRNGWIEESADELAANMIDFHAHDQRIEKLRKEALTEIANKRGILGILALSEKGNCQYQIGSLLVSGILSDEQIEKLILQCLCQTESNSGRKNLVAGMLWSLNEDRRNVLYARLRGNVAEKEAVRILLLSPYRTSTWELVDKLSVEARSRYWNEVVPRYSFDSPEDNNESVRRLLEAERPWAAFASIDFKFEKISPSLLVRILSDMVKDRGDEAKEYKLSDYSVRRAFQVLEKNSDLSLEEKGVLEFAYLEWLARSFPGDDQHQIPNLERYIEEHPELFVQAVVWGFPRKDAGEDPPEYRVTPGHEYLKQRGCRLLDAIERIPGQDEPSQEDQLNKLTKWVDAVRRNCTELGRAEVADVCLGKLLSHAPVGADRIWPNEAVRDVMEKLQSEAISRGAHIGLYNARGPHWRGEGGDQERELADKYRVWAEALQFTHPFLSSTLLMSMVKTYEREAKEHDTEAAIQRRVGG